MYLIFGQKLDLKILNRIKRGRKFDSSMGKNQSSIIIDVRSFLTRKTKLTDLYFFLLFRKNVTEEYENIFYLFVFIFYLNIDKDGVHFQQQINMFTNQVLLTFDSYHILGEKKLHHQVYRLKKMFMTEDKIFYFIFIRIQDRNY